MNVKVHDLMTASVVTTEPHRSIEHVRKIMERNKIGALPVVDSEGQPVGIISTTDLVPGLNDNSPVSKVMTKNVYTVPEYDDVSTAARIMRNHNIHRVVVTHEKKVVGVLSTFDLLELVEQRRFTAKAPPTRSKRKGTKRS
ncbi:MAG: CBS domain-containing protein [Myxococcales bacterium]|nr:CBS domain-containing protein [Myxococcales bacterium]MDH5305971.1 CBS domain-containing protein [Myxococcales bacterium]MDH5567755.1 CBS domain-containing protein [Myxococcales bacterium]